MCVKVLLPYNKSGVIASKPVFKVLARELTHKEGLLPLTFSILLFCNVRCFRTYILVYLVSHSKSRFTSLNRCTCNDIIFTEIPGKLGLTWCGCKHTHYTALADSHSLHLNFQFFPRNHPCFLFSFLFLFLFFLLLLLIFILFIY